ncbi:MAG TPA: hypothetical protein DCM05_01500 [Elusimicrobia bacterium]|nr:hypothetical protein [Elusimicrobiota bacterium]
MADKTISITYRFRLDDGKSRDFSVYLDRPSLRAIPQMRDVWPEWTKLSFLQCPNCPLTENDCPRCPIAANLVDLVDAFKDFFSTEPAQVDIIGEVRTLSKRTSLAEGVSSLLSIYMTTSGCPIMDKLRPNLRTYLPFPTIDEMIFRTLSIYMLAQHFIARRGGKPDILMEDFGRMIEDSRTVNRTFCQRLSKTSLKDVNINAVVHLDCFAELTTHTVQKQTPRFNELEMLFDAYLNDKSRKTPPTEDLS